MTTKDAMTTDRRGTVERLNLEPRSRSSVIKARPCSGDHKSLVRATLEDTMTSQAEALRRLAKI